VRIAIAGSMVVTLASWASGKAGAAGSIQLTADQQSIVLLAARQELSSDRNKGWKSTTPLCLRVLVEQDEEEVSREAHIPPGLLQGMNSGGRKVFAAGRCIVKSGDQEVRYRDPEGRAAYLLDVGIFREGKGSESAQVEVNLTDHECVPLGCDLTTSYDAQKTKRGWTVEYRGQTSD